MPTPKFDRDRAAKILIDAETIGDKATVEKWDITRTTLSRYRVRLSDDAELFQLIVEKKELRDQQWALEIPELLSSGVAFLKRATQEADPKDAEAIHAIAGALKIMAGIETMNRMINARMKTNSKANLN